jgi:hypothetical protein
VSVFMLAFEHSVVPNGVGDVDQGCRQKVMFKISVIRVLAHLYMFVISRNFE